IHKVVDTFTKQVEVSRYARMVPLVEIADPKNEFNLNLPRYIDSTEPEDLQDIDGHLRGGIPERDLDALGAYWKVLPSVRGALFESAARPGYARLKLLLTEVKRAQPREIVQVKNKDNKLTWPEPHDYLKGKRRFKSDLVPAPILVGRFFVAERDAIEALDNQLATLEQHLDEMREESSGEEGLLSEVIEGEGDKQKIAAKVVKARLTEIGKDPLYAD